MMKVERMVLALVAFSICSSALARSSFHAPWTLDTDATRQPPVTISSADAGNGRLKFTSRTQSYTFNTDGQVLRTPMGEEQTFEEVGHSVYRIITKRNGRVLVTEICKVSSDGNNLSIDANGTLPSGQPLDN